MRILNVTTFAGVTMLLGCSSGEPAGSGDPAGIKGLAPPPEGQGIQFKMVADLSPGQETERCQLFQVGPEELVFNRSQVEYTAGSHHVLLYQTPYTAMPTEDAHGVKLDPTKVHGCTSGGPDRWYITRVVAGSQNADGDNALDSLPEGVAMKVAAGTVLLMDTHYVNSAAETITTDARINVYTVPPERVTQEAGALFLYNPFIRIPSHAKHSAQMRCPMSQDIKLLNLQSHMHKRGVGFVANLTDSDGALVDELYTNDQWEGVPIGKFGAGLEIKAGQAIEYRCDYSNTEDRDVIQGLTSKDEMCMAVGIYYPRNDRLEVCVDDEGELAATWTGAGTATCGDSFKCLGEAIQGLPADFARAYFGCVVDSCPGASREISALVRCQISLGRGACDQACERVSDASCMECLLNECSAEITDCGAAKCE